MRDLVVFMEKEIFDVNLKAGNELPRDQGAEKTFQPEGWSEEAVIEASPPTHHTRSLSEEVISKQVHCIGIGRYSGFK